MKTSPFFSQRGCSGLVSLCSVALVSIPLSAQSFVLSTAVEQFENTVSVNSDSDTTSTNPSSFSGVDQATAYSSQDGILNVNARTGQINVATFAAFSAPPSFPAPAGSMTAEARSVWEDTVTNNTGQSIRYRYV
ncbi:MAG: hypothetical protein ACQKBY_10830, partial [Verrucomicrobiales bacterium]